jgi:hypothetical protein
MCEHVFIHTSHTRVCGICGVEKSVLRLDTYNVFSAPLCKGYQRVVRFRQKLDKLIFLQNAPPVKCPIWKYLESQKDLTGPCDVRRVLRTYKGKNKHYDCIRLFTRVFTPFRVRMKMRADRLKEIMTVFFSSIIRLWGRYNVHTEMSFFSYDFLLRCFLERLDSPLTAFCKPVTCQKRHIRNNERLRLILAADGGGKYCQSSAAYRSLNVKRCAETPPCQQKLDVSPEAVVWGQDATCHAIRPLGGSPARWNMFGTGRGGIAT